MAQSKSARRAYWLAAIISSTVAVPITALAQFVEPDVHLLYSLEKWFYGEYVITMQSGRKFTSGRTYRQRMQGLLLRRRSG